MPNRQTKALNLRFARGRPMRDPNAGLRRCADWSLIPYGFRRVLLPPHFRSIVQGIEFRFSVGPNIHFSEICLLFCSLGDRSERLKVQVELPADFYLPVKTRHCAARFHCILLSLWLRFQRQLV